MLRVIAGGSLMIVVFGLAQEYAGRSTTTMSWRIYVKWGVGIAATMLVLGYQMYDFMSVTERLEFVLGLTTFFVLPTFMGFATAEKK